MSLFTSTLNVGAMVEPLTSQMADYLGVPAGLMVKQVARKERSRRIRPQSLRCDPQSWIRFNRDRCRLGSLPPLQSGQTRPGHHPARQETADLTLQVDSKHRGSVDHEAARLAPT